MLGEPAASSGVSSRPKRYRARLGGADPIRSAIWANSKYGDDEGGNMNEV